MKKKQSPRKKSPKRKDAMAASWPAPASKKTPAAGKKKKKPPRSERSASAIDLSAAYPKLAAAGWEYRGSGLRAEMEELGRFFADLGFATRSVPVHPNAIPPDCVGCVRGRDDVRRYRMLFTRPA